MGGTYHKKKQKNNKTKKRHIHVHMTKKDCLHFTHLYVGLAQARPNDNHYTQHVQTNVTLTTVQLREEFTFKTIVSKINLTMK